MRIHYTKTRAFYLTESKRFYLLCSAMVMKLPSSVRIHTHPKGFTLLSVYDYILLQIAVNKNSMLQQGLFLYIQTLQKQSVVASIFLP